MGGGTPFGGKNVIKRVVLLLQQFPSSEEIK